MSDENITLVGYHSKKQPYIGLTVSVLCLALAVLCVIFASGTKKIASLGLLLCSALFFVSFRYLSKQPRVALEVREDRYVTFYSSKKETRIDLGEVTAIHYWPWQLGLKIIFITPHGNEYFAYLLEDSKRVKGALLKAFEKNNVPIVKRYSK